MDYGKKLLVPDHYEYQKVPSPEAKGNRKRSICDAMNGKQDFYERRQNCQSDAHQAWCSQRIIIIRGKHSTRKKGMSLETVAIQRDYTNQYRIHIIFCLN